MGTFIFVVVMTGLGILFLKLKNETEIIKDLQKQGIRNPTKEDIDEEYRKRKSFNNKRSQSDQDDLIDKELENAITGSLGNNIVKATGMTTEKAKMMFDDENKKSWKQLGDEYEEQIAEYYKSLGYEVIERGKTLGRKDGGIDLIAKKESKTILIQCKNRNARIKQKDIKQFLFDTDKFIEENKITEEVELLYIIANDVLDSGAKWILKNERKNLSYKVIPYLDI